MEYAPLLCSSDSLEYYRETANILFTKREQLKGQSTRYALPTLNDSDQPWFGATLIKVQKPVRGAGSAWIAFSDVIDVEQWASVEPAKLPVRRPGR